MNFTYIIAHAEDLHTADTSEFVHRITQLEFALPLYIFTHIAIYYLLAKSHKKNLMVPTFLALNLLIGVLTYSLVPAVSVIAISAGIIGALILSFLAIASG